MSNIDISDSLSRQLQEFEDLESDILMQDQYKRKSEKNKGKKKKDKKKSKGLKLKLQTDTLDEDMEEVESMKIRGSELLSASDLSSFDSLAKKFKAKDYGPAADLVDKESRSYSKNKNSTSKYKKEFAEEHSILYNQLKELLTFDKDISAQYTELRNNRVRGQSKFTSDILQSLTTIKRLKLDTTAKIIDLKKTIQDLALKEENQNYRNNKNKHEGSSSEIDAVSFLKDIMSKGRNNALSQLDYPERNRLNDPFDIDEDDEESMDDFISNSVKGFRSEEANTVLDYEDKNVKILIKRIIETGEWNYIAMDEDGFEVPDYPIPTKGKMSFSSDGMYGTDDFGRSYKVMELMLD